MNFNKKVTIFIPVYNAGDFIRPCVRSAIDQSYKNIEVIVSDNYSTDNTYEIVKNEFPEVTCYRNERNLGPVKNFNKIFEYASGDYCKILCADDVLYRDCIAKQVRILDKMDSVVLTTCSREIINQDDKSIMVRKLPLKQKVYSYDYIVNLAARKGKNVIGEPTATLFRMSAAKRLNKGFDEVDFYTVDIEYWLRLLGEGDLYYQKEKLVKFRVSSVSSSVGMVGLKQMKSYWFFLGRMKDVSLINRLLGYFAVPVNTFGRMLVYRFVVK